MTTTIERNRRSPWQVMQGSIYALLIRNFEKNFEMKSSGKRIFDLLRTFLEPAGHVLFWMMLKVFRYSTLDGEISPALFILLGVVPWLFFYNVMNGCIDVIAENRSLFFFRQIRPLDPVIALLFSEFSIMAIICCGSLFVLTLIGLDWTLYDPLRCLISAFSFVVFVLGLGIMFTIIGFFSRNIAKFLRVVLRFLYLVSGIFFGAQMLPLEYRPYFVMNPLFQCIEISRSCFSPQSSYSPYANATYLFQCAVISLSIGLGAYLLLRKKIMIEMMER